MVSEREQRNPLYHISPNAPLEVASGAVATAFPPTLYPVGTQIFSAFLAEPRTYGVTLRGKF